MAATGTVQDWLDEVRSLVMAGRPQAALDMLASALASYPDAADLRRAQAGILDQLGRKAEAEAQFQWLLVRDAGDPASAFPLARLLKDQGRVAAAGKVICTCLAHDRHRHDSDLAIRAVELLNDCDRKREAADIAEAAISANPGDPRLHAYAGMLAIQLGDFARARSRYLFALEHSGGAWEWHAPLGLATAQRYPDASHPDFALFRAGLGRRELSDRGRAELHFALGKANDDVGDYREAAQHFQEGNSTLRHLARWSRKAWRRAMDARLAARPLTHTAPPAADFTPIFIVGMPRSGTTLLARLLAQCADVCNRGELPWIAQLSTQPALAGDPGKSALQRAAEFYIAHTRRDDSDGARWFIDKQPLNMRYLDLVFAMFPAARVIQCRRGARDTALSLWMQCFLEDIHGYAQDFEDIRLVMRDAEKLMAHWHQRFPGAIKTVDYESLVENHDAVVGQLASWIGLRGHGSRGDPPPGSTISTASLWQARQPVTTRFVGRSRHYTPYLPGLARIR